jgi:DNA-binding HxlR family transcriptional regulator
MGIEDVLGVIGGKCAMPIIYNLSKGKMRFNEIESTIEGINKRMLVKELTNLEANGILTREVFAVLPPEVEYTLTKKGEDLLALVLQIPMAMDNYGKPK